MEAAHDNRRQLGQLMVDEGFLTLDQLSVALADQDRTGRPLGKVLVELGFVSEGAVANALAEQHGGLLKTEFGISAGLSARPTVVAVPVDASAARIAELEAEVRARTSESQAHEAEVARVTAAAVAHITKLEAELQAALAARAELETTVRLGATRLSELQHQLTALREAPVIEEPIVEEPVEQAHLLFTPSPEGYMLMELPGPAPASGTLLDVDGVGFVVVRIGRSPFPGSSLRCVFLERT